MVGFCANAGLWHALCLWSGRLIGSGGAKERLLAVGGSVYGDEQCSGVGAVGSFDSVGVITTGLGLEMRTAVMLTEEVPGNSTGVLTC